MVTGGTGFVGSYTVTALLEAGHDVRLLVRDAAKVGRVFGPRGVVIEDYLVGDITDQASVSRAFDGCDAVVHAAAEVSLEAHRAEEIHAINVRGVETVVEGACRLGIERIVYVSSVTALFNRIAPPITGDSPVAKSGTVYGRSKAACELLVRSLQERGAPIMTTYSASILGPGGPGPSEMHDALVTFMKGFVPLTSSGCSVVDVRDLADIHVALLESGRRPGRYAAGGNSLSWSELIAMLRELTGLEVRTVPAPGIVLRACGRVLDGVRSVVPVELPFALTAETMSYATEWPSVDSSRTTEELGMSFREATETMADSLRWLAREGYLEPRHIGRLADCGQPTSGTEKIS